MANVNRHLNGRDSEAFGNRIRPSDKHEQMLVTAANKIKAAITPAVRVATEKVLGKSNAVSPKYRLQGSWSYGTCNLPCHTPPQRIDYDLGIYLPIKVWEGTHPSLAASAYFTAVETVLQQLCRAEGWQLDTSNKKCARVIIALNAHIDVPLYAVPDSEFTRLVEARIMKAARADSRITEDAAFAEIDWSEINTIVLATRDGEWIDSDVRKIQLWFQDMYLTHGLQFKRICCYVKAWRDYIWSEGGPSSIALMICIAKSFKLFEGRDDVALYHVLKSMPDQLLMTIECHPSKANEDFNKLEPAERQHASTSAARFRDLMGAVVAAPSLTTSDLAMVCTVLGDRFPVRLDWVVASSPHIVVTSAQPRVVPVPRVTSGHGG